MAELFTRLLSRHHDKPSAASPSLPEKETSAKSPTVASERPIPLALLRLIGSIDKNLLVIDEGGYFVGASNSLLKLLGVTQDYLRDRCLGDIFMAEDDVLTGRKPGMVRFRDSTGANYFGTLAITDISKGGGFRIGYLTQTKKKKNHGEAVNNGPALTESPRKSRAAFGEAIEEASKHNIKRPELTAGRIELITLDDIKAELGEKWPSYADRARSVALSVLTRRLSDDDMFTEEEGGRFLICYSNVDLTKARRKTETIAHEIRERLLGESNEAFAIIPQADTVAIDGAEDNSEDFNVMSQLVQQLDDARSQMLRDIHSQFAELVNNASLCLTPVLNRKMTRSSLSVAGLPDRHIEWLHSLIPGEKREKITSEFDILLLGLAFKHIYTMIGTSKPNSVIVPVHYMTLNEKRYADKYFSVCQMTDEATRGRILFELHSVPPHVPDLRLQEILSRLAPFCAHSILRVSGPDHRLVDLTRLRVAMIAVAPSVFVQDNERLARQFATFARTVHNGGSFPSMCYNGGCRVLVHGVADPAAAGRYAAAGADLLTLRDADK